MPIITHPETGGRYDATDEQVRGFARSGWVVDDDQSPIVTDEPELLATVLEAPDDPLDLDDADPDDPAATATDPTEQE